MTTLIIFVILYLSASIWAVISVLLYGDRPARSIAWLFVVLFLPFLGVLFYVLFGINRKRFKFFSLNYIAKRKLYDLNHNSDTIDDFKHKFEAHKYSKIGKLLKKSSGFPAVDCNEVSVLKSGEETFEKLFSEIKKAKSFIHLEYYILKQGKVLSDLCDILLSKLEDGVEVRILYDAFGSYNWKTKKVRQLISRGAKVYAVLPIKLNTILSTVNYRNHRKLVVIDGVVAFTGGVNVADEYIDKSESPFGIWDDMHLYLKGSVVDHLHRVFIKDFYFASGGTLLSNNSKYLPEQKVKGGSLMQIVSGGPDLDHLSVLHQYVMMIHSATESVFIENPYFIPNKMLLEALKMASLRGVEVSILVPKHSDSRVAKYCMYSNFEDLLKVNINICLLDNVFSHSKLIIVDKAIASIGSGNFDYRSFEHNYELNTLIYDNKIAKDLASGFLSKKEKATVLKYNTYKDRSLKEKLLQGLAKIFSPLL
ncbi:cardiolipin synthase [Postechiella marina]|uniref:Cardiolipin synthase n=1 Tax=Postechiella marina TaxID=943941 RepID=A0ABP8CGK7_9FLAO